MVKITDIAKKCHVSVATVSRALNNQDDIRESTKLKIKKVAQEMGYMANASARALKTKRTYNIGLLFDDGTELTITHSYFSNILDSFKTEAESMGYDITFMNHHVGDQTELSYLYHANYRNFDGVAIIEADFDSKEIKELVDSDIPVVTLDCVFKKASAVISDNRQGLYALTDYAISKGHTKIAYIHGEDTHVTRDRIAGYYLALRENNLEINNDYLKKSFYHDSDLTNKCLRELLNLKDPPTCIIIPDDYTYLGVLKVLEELKLKPKVDISIMGYDGIELASILDLTTYRQDTKALGRLLADKLINQIEHQSEIECSVVTGELIHGNSVKKLK